MIVSICLGFAADLIYEMRPGTTVVLPISIAIFHVKGHQDEDKHWSEIDSCAQINILADRQANAIFRELPDHTGLFPTWVPGTCTTLFHGDRQQVIHNIPTPTYVRPNTPQKCDSGMR
jgi:hypothetical protein